MREIKFRVWDNLDKTMGSAENTTYIENNRPSEFNEFVFMQYTGLKDKKNEEIYEGDIVKWGHIKNREESWHRVAFVELFPSLQFHILHYIDGKSLEKKEGDNYVFGFHNFIYKDTHNSLEVIGNIYENKELLA